MPARQRGQVDRIAPHKWRLRYYLPDGTRKSKQPFHSKTEAWTWYRENVESLGSNPTVSQPDLTLRAFIAVYLERHSAQVRPRTVTTLRERLRHADRAFGHLPLRLLERKVDEIAAWHLAQPSGVRYARMSALRQTLEAARDWGHIATNPAKATGKNRQPAPREVRVLTDEEVGAIALALPPMYASLPWFVAATGLRPSEWQVLERGDVDRKARILTVRRTLSSGEVVELGKTKRSRRQVPLSMRALAALDAIPARLDTPLLFASAEGKVLHLDNFRHRLWDRALTESGVRRPARIYDLRSTFASNAIAAGLALFEIATIMGTSVEMLERRYGKLLDGASAAIAARLAAWEAGRDAGEAFGS